MRNRAKCKLCNTVIESLKKGDIVTCECKEIAVDGGIEEYIVYYKNVSNFLRIDDSDNVIEVRVKDPEKPSKQDLLQMLDEMIKKTEELPNAAMMCSVTHYDLLSFMLLVSAALKAD